MCFENVPCKALYSRKNGVWNGSQTMWDSFQTSAIIEKTCLFYTSETLAVCARVCLSTQAAAHICGPSATLVIYLQK